MALTAIGIGWYMLGRFAHGVSTVVTGCTVTRYTGVIILGADERRGVVTGGAVQRRGNMSY